jgi:hypothetical protein
MKKFLSAGDELLDQLGAQLMLKRAEINSKITRNEELTSEDLEELKDLSDQHRAQMAVERTYLCEGCSASHPLGTQSYLIARECIIYDASMQAPRHHTLPREVYLEILCPACLASKNLASDVGVIADTPAWVLESEPQLEEAA